MCALAVYVGQACREQECSVADLHVLLRFGFLLNFSVKPRPGGMGMILQN